MDKVFKGNLNNPMIDIQSYPNPVISDPRLADFHVEGIEQKFSQKIPIKETGILLVNKGIFPGNELFDPKINDTLILNTITISKTPSCKNIRI